MAEDINLMPQITEEEVQLGQYRRRASAMAMVALLVVGLIILCLFGAQIFLGGLEKKYQSDTEDAEGSILAQSRKEITYRSFIDKIDAAVNFLNAQKPYSEGYGSLDDIIKKSKVTLVEGSFNEDGLVEISGKAATSGAFTSFIDKLTSESFTGMFADVDLVKLTRETEKKGKKEKSVLKPYEFTVDFKFTKNGLVPKSESE